jgi:hypothetical protein
MLRALTLALLLLAPGCKKEQTKPPPPKTKALPPDAAPTKKKTALPYRTFGDAAAALKHVLDKHDPLAVGFGEFHQKTDSVKVRSAVRRFSEQLVAPLSSRASDLVVETWITKGSCGKQEKAVVKQVETTTKRPEATESEVVKLLKRAKGAGIRPHILEVGCDDYKQLLGAGKVDYAKLLGMITKHLRGKAERLVTIRAKKPAAAVGKRPGKKPGKPRRLVVVYGGALHNDLYPYDDLKDFTFGQALKQRTGGRYVEVDLYVPEYVQKDKNLAKEAWFPLLRLASPRGVVLIERGVGSYILLLKRGIAP